METQILKLDRPYEYIYCNGKIGKHIATYIVGETKKDEDGNYSLETHSHPIVQYKDSPRGVVWNRAELTDCEVICNEDDMHIDVEKFFLLCIHRAGQVLKEAGDSDPYGYETWEHSADEAEPLKEKLQTYGIGFKSKEKVFEIGVEVGGCHEGYFAQLMELSILYFHHIEPTLEELGKRLTEEREYWEDLYDHAVKIKFTPESSTAEGFVENL